ncbi:hypothetical protein THYS13_13330 [Thermoanaerobacter sp. YS13]|nr:hypothetical protein THYS13_13330 [Thermoanaerobacter sp. YS13]
MSQRGEAVPGTDAGLNAEPARAESVSLAGEDAYGGPEQVVPKAVLNDVYADASYDMPILRGCSGKKGRLTNGYSWRVRNRLALAMGRLRSIRDLLYFCSGNILNYML